MKIGYLVPEFPGLTHAFFWREVLAFEQAGAEVTLFSTRKPLPETCPHAFRAEAAARTHYLFPPPVHSLPRLLRHPVGTVRSVAHIANLRETPVTDRVRLLALLGSAAELARLCAERQIAHLHIHSCANAAHLGTLARHMGGPTFSLTLHGDLPVYGTDHASKFAEASFVSAVTEPLATAIRGVSPRTHAPVIWMGVDTERFRPADPPRVRRTAGEPFHAVTVARLNHTKGHAQFLAAMARAVAEGIDVQYQIAGEGPERDRIAAEVARLGLSDRVALLGGVGEGRVVDLLNQADAVALTSFGQGEAAPVAVMEAMACGVPAICSIIGGTPAMIADGEDGILVPQKDHEAIAAAIRTLALDPDAARRMLTDARRKDEGAFDYRANARKLLGEIEAAFAAAH